MSTELSAGYQLYLSIIFLAAILLGTAGSHYIGSEKCMYILRPRKCKILAFWNDLPCDVLQVILMYHSFLPKHSYLLRKRRKKNYLENNLEN